MDEDLKQLYNDLMSGNYDNIEPGSMSEVYQLEMLRKLSGSDTREETT